jgi:SAM-dependent methyltransferase
MDSSSNRRGWAERTGKYSPAFYARVGSNKVSKSLVTVLDHYSSTDASVLELGCSSGRHLAHLYENGYQSLTGIDINDDSFRVMADSYPALAEAGTFHTGAIEDIVPEFDDDAFDIVYSVETLQHIHPDNEDVFDELGRITGDLLVTVESEGEKPDERDTDETVRVDGEFPLYLRNWNDVFTDVGFTQQLRHASTPDTIRVFTTPERPR